MLVLLVFGRDYGGGVGGGSNGVSCVGGSVKYQRTTNHHNH